MALYIIDWITNKNAREEWLRISKKVLEEIESTLKALGVILWDWLPTTKSAKKALELSEKWLKIYSITKRGGGKNWSPCTIISEISTDKLDEEREKEVDRIVDRINRE